MMQTEPSLGASSFSCPHCRALAHQTWFELYLQSFKGDEAPFVPRSDIIDRIMNDLSMDSESKDYEIRYFRKVLTRSPFIHIHNDTTYLRDLLANCHVSSCFSCNKFSILVYDSLVYPDYTLVVSPADDMPADVRSDFEEAGQILARSPRGAAALLRLCVQRLCRNPGCKGTDINADIGELVARGLSAQVQQALDIVRVIGNNAVHPGELDLKDDTKTAMSLMHLVNMIVETQITQPRQLNQIFQNLPEGARKQIARRDNTEPGS